MDLISAPFRRSFWPWIALCAVPFAALVWRFDFLCDDAYISFRYARHLASGLGLRYNPGEQPPVEGFTNLGWVLVLAVFERAGLGSELGSRVTSAACGALLLAALGRRLVTLADGDRRVAFGALLFPATFAPLAAWTTGGLETMAFTLCAFLTYDRLLAPDGRPRVIQASLAGVATLLLRADGFVWLVLILGAALVDARVRRSPARLRGVVRTGAVLALALGTHLAWRWLTFEAFAPNTARIKIALGWSALERGGRYLASFLLSFPSALLVLGVAALVLTRSRVVAALPALLVLAGNLAYVVLVGGDFMAMGRFLVPSTPFLALLLVLALRRLSVSRRPGPLLVAPLVIVLVGLSLLSASGRYLVPVSTLEALDFRWSSHVFHTEVDKWRSMKTRAAAWAAQGRMLARISEPGDSLVIGTIGAVGYFSGLVIHDPLGLVNREALAENAAAPLRSAGHERRVPMATFVARRPTFLESSFVPERNPLLLLPKALREGGEFHALARPEWIRPEAGDGVPAGIVLRVVRYAP